MKLHKPLLALTKDNKPFVRAYTEPEPSCEGKPHCMKCLNDRCKYLQWKEKSQIDLPVCEESVGEFLTLIRLKVFEFKDYNHSKYLTETEKGINVDHLIDRLEVIEVWYKNYYPNEKYTGRKHLEQQIKLLPIKEEESELDRLVGWFRKRVEIKDHEVDHLKFVMKEYKNLNP